MDSGFSAEQTALERVFAEVRACTLCARHLPLGPRPVVRGSASARLLIVSQAPGTRVHMTGRSFNDRSGDRLRDWLQMSRATFYDERRVAILGMAFCYPGVDAKGGDLPPRPECAPHWHHRILEHMPGLELTLLVGSYAIRRYLGRRAKRGMTETVQAWRDYLPEYLPLPHPSWRNTHWLQRNPWFAAELLPELRRRVRALV
ncbi:MAG TPA: uracil-DNA glycosylase family protein [Stellaceae bacterium]|nr:uracil-DNA glycosylase family protein [Stellaceae bacterium]